MLRQRLLIALLILPPGLLCILLGGIWYLVVMTAIIIIAGREYAQMLTASNTRPAQAIIIGGALALALVHVLPTVWPVLEPRSGVLNGATFVCLLVVGTLWHLVDYERGAPASGVDWAITLTGVFFIGLTASYIVLLRNALPNGLEWTLIVLPAIWMSDTGAYVAGKRWGKHAMTPRLSPKKTWEGFAGGIVWGIFFGGLFAFILGLRAEAGPNINLVSGAVIGGIASLAGVLGDLSISMLKRQIGIKDTGNLLGAHGGLLDRIDSWLIGGPVAYFVILLFFH
jgi:phosphatidate cytidylyltransferase